MSTCAANRLAGPGVERHGAARAPCLLSGSDTIRAVEALPNGTVTLLHGLTVAGTATASADIARVGKISTALAAQAGADDAPRLHTRRRHATTSAGAATRATTASGASTTRTGTGRAIPAGARRAIAHLDGVSGAGTTTAGSYSTHIGKVPGGKAALSGRHTPARLDAGGISAAATTSPGSARTPTRATCTSCSAGATRGAGASARPGVAATQIVGIIAASQRDSATGEGQSPSKFPKSHEYLQGDTRVMSTPGAEDLPNPEKGRFLQTHRRLLALASTLRVEQPLSHPKAHCAQTQHADLVYCSLLRADGLGARNPRQTLETVEASVFIPIERKSAGF